VYDDLGGAEGGLIVSELRMGLWPTHRDENRVEPEARGDFRRSCRGDPETYLRLLRWQDSRGE
jgi:hypothetical protein